MKYVNMNLEMKSINVTFNGFLQVKEIYLGDMFIRKNIQILEHFNLIHITDLRNDITCTDDQQYDCQICNLHVFIWKMKQTILVIIFILLILG